MFKCVLFFEAPRCVGWSETHWLNVASFEEALAIGKRLRMLRAQLSPTTVTLARVRVTNPAFPRGVQDDHHRLSGQFDGQMAQSCYSLLLNFVHGTRRTKHFLGGLPSHLLTQMTFNPDPRWQHAFQRYRDSIREHCVLKNLTAIEAVEPMEVVFKPRGVPAGLPRGRTKRRVR
jgi:hypothetical protein